MYEAEFELEAELEDLMSVLAKSNLASESEIPSAPLQQPQTTQLTCAPAIVLNGFRSGDYTLRRQHYASLLAISPRLPANITIVIRGHTDNQGDAVSNTGLSFSRAFEVLHWLQSAAGNSVIADNVLIDAAAATTPVASNATEAGRSANRRVEIFFCLTPPPPPPPPQVASSRILMRGRIA